MNTKNTKKLLSCILTVSLLTLPSVSSLANAIEKYEPTNILVDTIPTSSEDSQDMLLQTYFMSFTGTVKDINDFKAIEGSKIVFVENEEGNIANLIISNDTYIVDNEEIALGNVITGYYDANAPMIMIYPPQYNIKVANIDNNEQNVKFDRFDKDLVSSDKSLKLNISKDTQIVSQDGKAFEGEITDKNLVVIYGISTRSIPAQTTPSKIVVIQEKNIDSKNTTAVDYASKESKTIDEKEIVVNNNVINAPSAYTNDQDTVMLPLRAIAETLGYDVKWDNLTKSVIIGRGISLTIGIDNYNYMKTAPIQLGTSPEIIDNKTFVPLSFFKEVMRINDVNIYDSSIVINDTELSD